MYFCVFHYILFLSSFYYVFNSIKIFFCIHHTYFRTRGFTDYNNKKFITIIVLKFKRIYIIFCNNLDVVYQFPKKTSTNICDIFHDVK